MRELIVDGYNALHALERYADLLDSDLEQARERLIHELSEHRVAADIAITVVFDAHRTEGLPVRKEVDGVTVMFGTKRQSADHLIERRVYEASRDVRAHDVVVATNDRLIGDVVCSMGAAVISIQTLDSDLQGPPQAPVPRATSGAGDRLEDGMDAALRAQFERLRRGITDDSPAE